ncbi:MAG: MFS transporter [Deltaproteobacteria bacterium]|nr:MFS transporter [Deltaproteobacteria bacterium]
MSSPQRGPLGESWQAWIALAVGVVAISAHTASSMTFAVLMKPLLEELGWARTDFAGAMTLRMAVMVLVLGAAGLLTDRIGARLVLAAGALIIGVGNLALSTVHSLPSLYIIMAWLGPGQAAIGSVAASALVLRLFERRRSLAIGILNGGDNLLNSGIYLGAAALLAAWGWRATLSTLAGAYFVLAVLILLVLRRSGGEPAARRGAVRLRDIPWRDRRLWLVCLAYAGIYAFVTSVQLHLHAFLTDIGHSPAAAASVLSTLTLVGAIGSPLFGWVAERSSARFALLLVCVGLAASSVALWTVTDLASFTTWAVFYGLVNSGVVALLTLVLAELFGADQIGRLMGVAMMVCMSATMAGNMFSAQVFDRLGDYRLAWQTYTAIMVAVLVPVLWLWRAPATPTAAARITIL